MGEPRARAGKNRGQQQFSNEELKQLLFAHGDILHPLEPTYRTLDQILTDFITSLAFETGRSAAAGGRQKIKLDDVKFACRNHPAYLGRIEEMLEKKQGIDQLKKAFDEKKYERLDMGLTDDEDEEDGGGSRKGRRGRKRKFKETKEEEDLAELNVDVDLEEMLTVGAKGAKAD